MEKVAIVCSHVVEERRPILRAVREAPVDPDDSGWQFVCGSGVKETEQTGRVMTLPQVLQLEPSLRPHLQLPSGTVLERDGVTAGWKRR